MGRGESIFGIMNNVIMTLESFNEKDKRRIFSFDSPSRYFFEGERKKWELKSQEGGSFFMAS